MRGSGQLAPMGGGSEESESGQDLRDPTPSPTSTTYQTPADGPTERVGLVAGRAPTHNHFRRRGRGWPPLFPAAERAVRRPFTGRVARHPIFGPATTADDGAGGRHAPKLAANRTDANRARAAASGAAASASANASDESSRDTSARAHRRRRAARPSRATLPLARLP